MYIFRARSSDGHNFYFEAASRSAVERWFKRHHGATFLIKVRLATEMELASLRQGFKQIVRCESGAAAPEYALLLAFVALTLVLPLAATNGAVYALYATLAELMGAL